MKIKLFNAIKAISVLLLIGTWSSCNTNDQLDRSTEPSHAVGEAKISIAQTLQAKEHLPIADRIALYRQLKSEEPTAYNFENEDEMTMYGYRLLWSDQLKDALEVFKLIVEFFPDSSNPYDSLGEAYLAVGDSVLSLKNYAISLNLNPDNFNAEDQIERIRFPHKQPITPQEKFGKVYGKQAYVEDLQQLSEKLLEVHPAALKFIAEEDYWKTVASKKALVTDSTTFAEFAWLCREIIANINCSHTSISNFSFEKNMLPDALLFPLQTRLIDGRLYVLDAYANSDIVSIKDEITAINDVPVDELITEIYSHLQSQGYVETTKRHEFNLWSTVIIPSALNFPENYTIKVKGKQQPTLLRPLDKIEVPYRDFSIPYCGENLCLEILERENTGFAFQTIIISRVIK